MKNAIYVTVDGGTTNTRISLVRGGMVIQTIKLSAGCGNTDKNSLSYEIKNGINDILSANSIDEKSVSKILASGMLTSGLGICELDHAILPIGLKELHMLMKEVELKNISNIPFVFVRGIKKQSDELCGTDIMRGEETELMGIADKKYGDCIYILPGTHSKIIHMDENGKIDDFSTMMTGEMIAALSKNTILRDAFSLETAALNTEFLLKGFDYCRKFGINESLFKIRVLKNNFSKTSDECYSFFLGTVLCGEIISIINNHTKNVVIGGRKHIRLAIYEILKNRTHKSILALDDKEVDSSVTNGLIKIYECGLKHPADSFTNIC